MVSEVLPSFQGHAPSINRGFDKPHSVAAVRLGSRIRGRFALVQATSRPRCWS